MHSSMRVLHTFRYNRRHFVSLFIIYFIFQLLFTFRCVKNLLKYNFSKFKALNINTINFLLLKINYENYNY